MGCFSAGLKENKAMLPGESFSLLSTHLPTGVLIALVANKHNCSVGIAILSNFFEPSS